MIVVSFEIWNSLSLCNIVYFKPFGLGSALKPREEEGDFSGNQFMIQLTDCLLATPWLSPWYAKKWPYGDGDNRDSSDSTNPDIIINNINANSFAQSEILIQNVAHGNVLKISLKTCKIFKKIVRLRQKHEQNAFFPSFAFKSVSFAQILEIFAQTCVCMC